MFAAKFYISSFIFHASAVDIIWETGFVMAQLWPSFSPPLPFFFPPALALQPLDIKMRHFRPGTEARIVWELLFPSSSQPAQAWSKEPTTLLGGCSLASSFTLHPLLHLGLRALLGKRFYLYGLFPPSLRSIFLRHHEIKILTRNRCHVSVY